MANYRQTVRVYAPRQLKHWHNGEHIFEIVKVRRLGLLENGRHDRLGLSLVCLSGISPAEVGLRISFEYDIRRSIYISINNQQYVSAEIKSLAKAINVKPFPLAIAKSSDLNKLIGKHFAATITKDNIGIVIHRERQANYTKSLETLQTELIYHEKQMLMHSAKVEELSKIISLKLDDALPQLGYLPVENEDAA